MTQKLSPTDEVIERAGQVLGSTVAGVEALAGGYTPQSLCRLELADARTAVLKAAPPQSDPEQKTDWQEILRREIGVYKNMPHFAPWRPAFLGDFEAGGWVALLLEDLSDARRVPPWTAETISACARGLAEMHTATLSSGPPDAGLRGEVLRRLTQIREAGRQLGDLPTPADAEAWWHWLDAATDASFRFFDEETEEEEPRCFIHYDVRSDNLFLRGERLILIDWSAATWKTPYLDSVYWALGVEVEEGGAASLVHEEYLAHAPFRFERGIAESVAFCSAYFLNTLQTAASPQHVQAVRRRFLPPTIRWLAQKFQLPPPPE